VASMRFPPPWFFPLHPLFRGAPFFKEHRQGEKPIHVRATSALTGGNRTAAFTGAADRRGASFSTPAAPRRPTGARHHSAALPPCATAPRGRARWSGRNRLRPFRSSHGVRPSVESREYAGSYRHSQTRLVVLTGSGNNPRFTVAGLLMRPRCRCSQVRHRHAAAGEEPRRKLFSFRRFRRPVGQTLPGVEPQAALRGRTLRVQRIQTKPLASHRRPICGRNRANSSTMRR
jgi:hypothetical protein